MATPLRVLMAEDIESDAELNAHELRRGGFDVVWKRVDTESEFIVSLADFRPDLVLCDHTIPGFSGTKALRLACERSPHLPVIVVTGSLDEETAVETMKAGAWDYVLKDRRARLGAAAVKALQEARAVRERRLADARLKAIVDTAVDGLITIDADGLIATFNPAAERQFGYAASEVVGRNVSILMPLPDALVHDRHLRRYQESGQAAVRWRGRELVGRARDGREFPIQLSLTEFRLDGSRAFAGVVHDLTEEKRLRASLEMAQFAMDSSRDMVLWATSDGRVVYANESAARSCGATREALLARHVWDVSTTIQEDPWPQTWEELRACGSRRFEDEVRRADGTTFPAEVVVTHVRVGTTEFQCAVIRDISERRSAEQKQAESDQLLRQSQKMEAIGRLAGGVAHDFNNVLGVIAGFGELASRQLPPDHPVQGRLEQIRRAAGRAAELTRQMLAFSRKQVLHPRPLDLNKAIASTRTMLAQMLGEDVQLIERLEPALGTVIADPTQVEQVLMNLAVNARDAMPDGGWLSFETANVELDEEYVRRHGMGRPAAYVMLSVSDTGIGMAPETQAHIFEPFFTTKPEGQGTGLGLATVYGIVNQSGGFIWVYSEPGYGATFKIYLPRVDEPAEPLAPAGEAGVAPPGDETILVVEDQEALREMIVEVLSEQGYALLAAGTGAEALALARSHAGPVHLLLTDLVLPGMSGRQLTDQLTADRPGLRVLHMSGYSAGSVAKRELSSPAFHLLEKPFTATALAQAIRQALDAD